MEVYQFPALQDNYCFLLHDPRTGATVNPKPYTLIHNPCTRNPKPYTPNPKPQILHPLNP